jgi:hypothetical protein
MKKITKKQVRDAGWIFSGKEGEDIFIKNLNKTLDTEEKQIVFLNAFKKKNEKTIN